MGGKSRKKKEAADEDMLLPDLNDSTTKFCCETCGISFTDAKSRDQHLNGKKHSKKMTETRLKENKSGKKYEESDEDDSDGSGEFCCEICNKKFSGYLPYAAHVKGSSHAKNIKKQKLKKQLADMPEVLDNKIEDKISEEKDSDDDILPKVYARCSMCQKEFSGPESFNMHLKSAVHLKKVNQAKILQKLKKDEEKISNDEEIYTNCKICKKSFSGVVPYQIHMKSNVHKKNLEKKKISEEIKDFCSNSDFDDGYVCKECNKTFTDPLAFKCHLENNSHEKQKAKEALSSFLTAHPEIIYVTAPYGDVSEDGNNSDDSDSMYYLICKLCSVSFSGPESAQDHVNGKKHINIKKEKKILKLMKEKQKNSPLKHDSKIKSNEALSGSKKENTSEKDYTNISDDFEVI